MRCFFKKSNHNIRNETCHFNRNQKVYNKLKSVSFTLKIRGQKSSILVFKVFSTYFEVKITSAKYYYIKKQKTKFSVLLASTYKRKWVTFFLS